MKVEVSSSRKGQIDWSKPQLVVGDGGSIVMITHDNKQPDHGCFCGVKLTNGEYSRGWGKLAFTPFIGEVTIKND